MEYILPRDALFNKRDVPPELADCFEPAACGQCFVCRMVEVFREVRRVLRDDGTCWINLGDSYASTTGGNCYGWQHGESSERDEQTKAAYAHNGLPPGLKPKDLCGIPWRVALALQADGWYLRSDIIWHKPNPMPESCTDRPTKAHEYVFLLSKSPRYFYDADAVREANASLDENGCHLWTGKPAAEMRQAPHKEAGRRYSGVDVDPIKGAHGLRSMGYNPAGRNRRTVWTVATQPYSGAHFACFPPKLIEPCIMAGTSERGCCAECGAPMVREVERKAMVIARSGRRYAMGAKGQTQASGRMLEPSTSKTVGWSPSCSCDAGTNGCMVLDPFLGSGTVGEVCEALGRQWFGIELNPDYEALIRERTKQMGLFGRTP